LGTTLININNVGADMSLSISNLLDFIRSAYNVADNDDFFKEQWILNQLWAAENELAIIGWVIERSFTTTSTAGTRAIAWPTNALAIKELRYKGKKLLKLDLEDDPKNDDNNPTGTPTSYAIWEKEIILFPTPAISADTIQVRTYQTPAQITSTTSSLSVPDEYQIGIADKVLFEMAAKDQNINLATIYKNKWDRNVEKAKQNMRRQKRSDRCGRTKDYYFGSDTIQRKLYY
jgi:hypothetical protein